MTSSSGAILRDPASLVASGVLWLFVIAVVLTIAVVLHHVITERQRRSNRLRFETAALTLVPDLIVGTRNVDRAIAMARLNGGDHAVALVLRKVRHDVKGHAADRASAVLNEMGEVRRLMRDVKSRREWKRLAAIRGLAECGGAKARRALSDAASRDTSEAVRAVARHGLLRDGSEEAIGAAVASFLASPPRNAGARHSFFMRLAIASDTEIADIIRSGELPLEEQKLALEAAGDAGRRAALALAKEQLMSPHAEMRATAVRVIGKLGGSAEIRMATHALDDNEWFVRAAASRTLEWLLPLARSGDNTSIRRAAQERLHSRLSDSAWWVRANSARALAGTGEEGVALLHETAESADPNAKEAAVAALAMVGNMRSFGAAAAVYGEAPAEFDPDATLGGERTLRPGGMPA